MTVNNINVPDRNRRSGAGWIVAAVLVGAAIIAFLIFATPKQTTMQPVENNVTVEQPAPPASQESAPSQQSTVPAEPPAAAPADQPAASDPGAAPADQPQQ